MLALVAFTPFFVFASATVNSLISQIAGIAQSLLGLLIGLGVFMLVWGIFKFIANAGDETARAEGRQLILWGVIGIFAMVSVWGLVNILVNTFDLDSNAVPAVPQLPTN